MSSVFTWGTGLVGTWLPTFLLVLFITLLVLGMFGGRPKNFPPGLMILPVVGSFLSMPFGPSLEVLRGLRKKYGDMASFAIFGTRIVVVSSVNLMKEVFGLRASTDRPEVFFSTHRNRIMTDGRSTAIGVIGSSGQVWQEQRRFMLHHLRDLGFGKSSYEPVMVEEIAELMDLLKKEEGRPLEVKLLFNRSVVNIIWAMVMGTRYHYGHDKLNKLMANFVHTAEFNALTPLYHIPHVFKIMHYLPRHSKGHRFMRRLINFIKEEIKEFMDNEELKNSDNFAAVYLREIEKKENPNFNMDQLSALIFDLFVAGMETTSSALTTAVYLISKHPHVQRRLQEELDEMVGKDRLPSFSDMDRLPYVQATIHEVQRVLNFVKFSLPHVANQDCKLGGYDIPKGTWLLANLDDALRSSEYWKNSLEFDPQNFLDENGKYKKNDAFMPFGVGKRVCAGESLARLELFLFFTHLFQRFTFSLVEEHKPIAEDNPMFASPPEYTATIKCRSI
uniref:Cytochrome P450 CYP330A1 n=1 Tax=Carcinus maenas TaxID=6759 RepID=Q6VT82_CARMA|nr:cytochrome P450 enzyme, CYP330A1 enzyme - green crab, common shore crab [Carcinus maenas]AAQ93009.1 cytochrome P450 CYP330A1 [Carcinus maenas]